jgi:hypothetical protein
MGQSQWNVLRLVVALFWPLLYGAIAVETVTMLFAIFDRSS